MTRKCFLGALLLAGLGSVPAATHVAAQAPAPPPSKMLLNLDRDGVAIQGHDPVAYFTMGKPVKGDPALSATHAGAIYHFASREHRDLFTADPEKYAPQFGGYCGYGASRGYPAKIDPRAFTIMNGRLILQYSLGVLETWMKDPEAYLRKADANWPGIVEKHGKPRS